MVNLGVQGLCSLSLSLCPPRRPGPRSLFIGRCLFIHPCCLFVIVRVHNINWCWKEQIPGKKPILNGFGCGLRWRRTGPATRIRQIQSYFTKQIVCSVAHVDTVGLCATICVLWCSVPWLSMHTMSHELIGILKNWKRRKEILRSNELHTAQYSIRTCSSYLISMGAWSWQRCNVTVLARQGQKGRLQRMEKWMCGQWSETQCTTVKKCSNANVFVTPHKAYFLDHSQ